MACIASSFAGSVAALKATKVQVRFLTCVPLSRASPFARARAHLYTFTGNARYGFF